MKKQTALIIFSIIIALAFAIRLFIILIHPYGAGYDLEIYTYFGRIVLSGGNPYLAPIDGLINPRYADMTPLNILIFAGILKIFNHPVTLQLFFAISECLAILLVLFYWKRSTSIKFAVGLFLAFNPISLNYWTAAAEDKTVVFLLIVITLLFVEKRSAWGAVIASALLAGYKFLGVFLIIPIIFEFYKDKKTTLLQLTTFGLIFTLSHLPFFPESLIAYQYRAERLSINPPIHNSPFLLLPDGWYQPIIAKILPIVLVSATYLLYYFKKINVYYALTLALFLSTLPAPEIGNDRIWMVTIPFFLLINQK